jgi:hypothetical protein
MKKIPNSSKKVIYASYTFSAYLTMDCKKPVESIYTVG